jgi:adenosylhomocysteinase
MTAGKIEWARQWMPVLATIGERIRGERVLAGVKVGVCLVLEPKTVNLALALHRAGANVALHAPAAEVSADVATAAADAGLTVFASTDPGREQELADRFLSWAPQILLDDGAAMIRRLHTHHPDVLAGLWGAAEETTSGGRPLRAMESAGVLRAPVLAVNDAPVKYLFDNVYGTAQSCLMTFLDLTNLQLAGRDCLVIGYGWVGSGLARDLAGFGAGLGQRAGPGPGTAGALRRAPGRGVRRRRAARRGGLLRHGHSRIGHLGPARPAE